MSDLSDLIGALPLDDEISEIRRRRGMEYLRPRYTRPLLLLDQHGAQTIRSLAELAGVSHSAMSQSVTAMRADDLVKSQSGPDARTRLVSLTPLGVATIPFLQAESVAKREVVRQLEAEASHPLGRAVDATMQMLDDRSFADRLEAQM